MAKEFQENTVAIILNELFNYSKELKTQMQFDALIEKYAERIVKLFLYLMLAFRCPPMKKLESRYKMLYMQQGAIQLTNALNLLMEY